MATTSGGLDGLEAKLAAGKGKGAKDIGMPTIAVTARVMEEKKPVEKAAEPTYASQEERVQAFMDLLMDVRVELPLHCAPLCRIVRDAWC